VIAVAQQLSIATGVAVGALAVDVTLWWRGHDTIVAADFQPAWLIVADLGAELYRVWRMPRMPAPRSRDWTSHEAAPSAGAKTPRQQIELGRIGAAGRGFTCFTLAKFFFN